MALGRSVGRVLRQTAEARRPIGCLRAAAGCLGCAGVLVALLVASAVALPVAWVAGSAALRERDDAVAVMPGRRVDVGGLGLHVTTWGPEGGRPVVLVHGSASWGGTWEEVAAPLGAAGYHVIALDLPPFGFSERPADHRYDAAAQAARIAGLVEALDLHDVTLVGHSFGGGPTGLAAHRLRERLGRLVLIDVALGLPPPGTAPAPPSFAARATVAVAPVRDGLVAATLTNPAFLPTGLRTMVADGACVTPARVARYARPLTVRGTTRAVGRWSRELVAPAPSAAADPATWAAIDAPTLILWGRDDRATPLDQGERLHALIQSSQLAVLDGVGHIPQIEDPAAVTSQMLRFFRSSR